MSEVNSVLGNFFYGEVHDNDTFPFPAFSQDQKEMGKEMVQAVDKFAQDNIDSRKFDEAGEIPKEVIQGLAELGLCGLAVQEEYGGLELDYSLYARVFAEVACNDGSCATMLGAHQSIGYRALINEGNEEQKKKWLPRLASGEAIASFCLTEPGAGSDAYSIKTKAVKQADGTYKINGQKLWITNAGTSEFYTVFAKTDHDKDGETVEKITCFIVEKGQEGVSFGEKENKMGIRASETRAIYFDNVIVTEESIIGQPGKGFKVAMNVLNSGRLSLGSGCVGGMKTAIAMAIKHAKERKQFDTTLTEFGMIQEKIAYMSAKCYATESMVYFSTGKMVQGLSDYSLESAACKIYGSENLWSVSDMAMQIAAGTGYMKEYPYELLMRDARIHLIFEGTNEILRCLLSLSGIKGPSEDLKDLGKISDVSKALNTPIKSLGVLTSFAKKRIGKMIPSKTISNYHPKLEEHAQHFSSMLSGFAIQVENSLIKYGKNIIHHELPQKRLANMAIELYAILSVISRTTYILEQESIDQKQKDYVLSLTNIVCHDARKKFVSNLKGMTSNIDKEIKKSCECISEHEGYGLDILDY